jgi:hypothetical protein
MKRYCTSCGSPTEYSVKKPIFCSNCGISFDKTQVNRVIPMPIVEKRTINPVVANNLDYEIDNELDNETDDVNIPNISQIQIDVESDNDSKAKGIKLGQLLGTSTQTEKKPRERIKVKKNSKKQILEDFAKEAGTIKKSKSSR